MPTIDQAKDDLLNQYKAAGKVPSPVVGIQVGTYETREVIVIYVSRTRPNFRPPESEPGAGFQGFEVVSFLGPSQLISDSSAP